MQTKKLTWDEAETRALAAQVLTNLQSPRTLEALSAGISSSTFQLYRTVAKLLETEQVR